MDSKVVSREIRAVVRPMLADAGFGVFRGRDAWRPLDDQVWVVSFQSFNSHVAEGVGCTTYSFSIRLGLRLADDAGVPRTAEAYRDTGFLRLGRRVDRRGDRQPERDGSSA